jgi:hypothetical protein
MKMGPLENPRMVCHALNCARRKFKVFPVHTPICGACSCGDPDCEKIGKHPRTKNGLNDATTDRTTIRAWWQKWPDANIGLACGNGFFVVDVDPRHGGFESLAKLEDEHGSLPVTLTANSGGGGKHFFFRSNGNQIKGRIGMLPGIDIKSAGGYVVAAPSLHASGKRYSWAR